ncbi:MAG: asparagine synthase (glutamine-hydrolyzing) [Vicinamibacterales bacterium]|nr:asparagine synthase (glutamine-hydrolyzing) [Vicinamibacterales bacterium]
MCGIAGVVRFGAPVSDRHAAALLAALAHRGPDGEGVYTDAEGGALLVHRRLAIIAPGDSGRQPMASPDGRYWLTYNGEIYNHRELRAALAGGEPWRSDSDTEVLLRLLIHEGAAGLARVRGMFACALWDRADRTLLLARDRFGIKPLYWSATREGVVFASEVGALLAADLVPRRPSAAGVLAYLHWASIPPPLTWVEDVHALMPGVWRRFGPDGHATDGRFADVREAWVSEAGPPAGTGALAHRIEEGITDAVRAHLVADVPVGVFLSGGLDSAALVKASRAVSDAPVRTFTVVTGDAQRSEAAEAEAVACAYGTEHHVLHADPGQVVTSWPRMLRALDQPSVDGVNTFLVAGAVAGAGMKCVLSGIGGDELLGGYPSFTRIPRAARLTRHWPSMLPRAAAWLPALAAPAQAARWRHAAGSGGDLTELYRATRGFFMPGEVAAMAGPALRDAAGAGRRVDEVEHDGLAGRGDERRLASVARLETCGYLRQQLLRDVDAMSMAHGIEVRTPFVDHELLARAWPALGAHPGLVRDKQVLRRWLSADLPSVARRPKQGFLLPFDHWLDGPLRDLVRGGLADLEAGGWLAPGVPDMIWTAWQARRLHWTRPWGLAVLGRFLSHG